MTRTKYFTDVISRRSRIISYIFPAVVPTLHFTIVFILQATSSSGQVQYIILARTCSFDNVVEASGSYMLTDYGSWLAAGVGDVTWLWRHGQVVAAVSNLINPRARLWWLGGRRAATTPPLLRLQETEMWMWKPMETGVSGQARRMSPLANQTRLDDIPLAPLATPTRLPLPR